MKNSFWFFIRYYLKKHLGFLANASIDAADIFWKNFYRLRAGLPVKVIADSADYVLLECCVAKQSTTCYVRKAPSSDLFVFRQIFENQEYLPLINKIKEETNYTSPLLIIDAGANVGYTTLFFKHFFPNAMIIAIEPDSLNAEQIKKNIDLNNKNKVEILLAGVWTSDCWLELKKDRSEGQDWGFYVQESTIPTQLTGLDLLNLPQVKNGEIIDILKMDIEGGEAILFDCKEKINKLLSVTRYLALEIHDHLANRQHILETLEANNFSWFNAGELTIAKNQALSGKASS